MQGKRTVALEPNVWRQVEERAEAEGLTPEQIVNQAVQLGLEEGRWRRLLARGQRYRQESGYREEDVERVITEFRQEQRGR